MDCHPHPRQSNQCHKHTAAFETSAGLPSGAGSTLVPELLLLLLLQWSLIVLGELLLLLMVEKLLLVLLLPSGAVIMHCM